MKTRIINIITTVILTVSVIVGLLFNIKDQSGNLTDWGFLTLVISVFSGITGIISQILDFVKDKKNEELEQIKEQEHKKLLSEIQDNIIRSNSPLTPFNLFCTLKYIEDTSVIEDIVPRSGAINSTLELNWMKPIGIIRISSIPYNIEYASEKLQCTINNRDSRNMKNVLNTLKTPHDVEIDIYTSEAHESPDIFLKTSYGVKDDDFDIEKTKEARIYGNIIYQDIIFQQWSSITSKQKVFGISDLLHSRIKVKASFCSWNRTYEKDYPRFTNLHLYFGDNPKNLLSFELDELLSKQTSFIESKETCLFDDDYEDDTAVQMEQKLILEFEITITDDIFNNQINQFM